MNATYYHSPELPWTISEDDELRYRRILKRVLMLFLLLALVMPFLRNRQGRDEPRPKQGKH